MLCARAAEFRDSREPPIQIGDVVQLNSGGPASLAVDLADRRVTVSWRDEDETHEQTFPRACVHRVGVIDS
jgi:uncharacterized protein YodC (DUF2158 family)